MNVLLSASNAYQERARQLASGLSESAGPGYRARAVRLDECLDSVADIDGIVLVHGNPTVELHTFIHKSREVVPDTPLFVVDVPRSGDLIAGYLMDGASGCLAAEHGVDELIKALGTMKANCPYLPPSVQAVLLQQFVNVRRQFIDAFGQKHGVDGAGLDNLTQREREVLELVAQKLTNREISERLYLEVGTVKNHVHSVLTKLNVRDRSAAAEYQRHAASFSSAPSSNNSKPHREMYPAAMSR